MVKRVKRVWSFFFVRVRRRGRGTSKEGQRGTKRVWSGVEVWYKG